MPAPHAFDLLLSRQRAWARGVGSVADPAGYLADVGTNLFAPLSAETAAEFGAGAGGETNDKAGKPAKMRALHSSSALVCNLFDYWRAVDPSAVGRSFGAANCALVRFEAGLPSGLRGTPPTLDLLLQGENGTAIAVESKFTEPYQAGKKGVAFRKVYFPPESGLWSTLGLPRCQRLAEDLRNGRKTFDYLDVAQLLKHALGVKRLDGQAALHYVWFDVAAPQARALEVEITQFADAVDPELGFRAHTHQQVFARLAAEAGPHRRYVEYMRSRYFPDGA